MAVAASRGRVLSLRCGRQNEVAFSKGRRRWGHERVGDGLARGGRGRGQGGGAGRGGGREGGQAARRGPRLLLAWEY